MIGDDDGHVTLAALFADAEVKLATVTDVPGVEARWIVEEVAGVDSPLATAELDRPVTRVEMSRFDSMLGRRLAGEPLQYVLGHWSFRSLDLAVDRRALIPRPETEGLVDIALAMLDADVASGVAGDPPQVFDMGSGTGAIALSVAVERPGTRVWAIERSLGAAQLTRENCAGTGRPAASVSVIESNWFDEVPTDVAGSVDLIVSNPPYVRSDDVLPASVAEWEPREALIADDDGRADLLAVVAGASAWLRPRGALCLELDPRQIDSVAEAMEAGGWVDVVVHPDLTGRNRYMSARTR